MAKDGKNASKQGLVSFVGDGALRHEMLDERLRHGKARILM
jgi:hypothetical protein